MNGFEMLEPEEVLCSLNSDVTTQCDEMNFQLISLAQKERIFQLEDKIKGLKVRENRILVNFKNVVYSICACMM